MHNIKQPLKALTLFTCVILAGAGFNSARADSGVSISFNLPIPLGMDVSVEWNYYPELEVYYNPRNHVYWYLEDGFWVRSIHYRYADELEHAVSLKLRHGHEPWQHHRHHRDYYHRHYRHHYGERPRHPHRHRHQSRRQDHYPDRHRDQRRHQHRSEREQLARIERRREPYYRDQLRARHRDQGGERYRAYRDGRRNGDGRRHNR